MTTTWKRGVQLWTLLVMAAAGAGCGADAPGITEVEADPAVAPFVGDWQADVLLITSKANPEMVADLIAIGSTFTLNVQPSGTYTAVLTFQGVAQTEIGDLSVSGSTLTMDRTFPSPQRSISTFRFEGSNRLILDGDTEFDFNLDGTPEPATAHIEPVRIS